MNRILQRLFTLTALMLLIALSVSSSFAQSTARVRFVHVTTDVSAIDIYVNGSLLVQDLDYASASLFFNVPDGDHTLTVTLANDTSPVFEQTITADDQRPATFILADGTQFFAVAENLNETPAGGARLLLIHALKDGPSVDIKLADPVELGGVEQPAGTPLATGMAYGTTFGAFDVPAQLYTVNVLAEGTDTAVLENLTLPLSAGTAYAAIVYGTPEQPQALLLTAAAQSPADAGLVRFVHAVVDGTAVDIYDGDLLIVPSLAENNASEHIALAAGDHTLIVRAAGEPAEDTNVLAQADVTVAPGSAQTVLAMEAGGAVVLATYADDVSGATESSTAAVSVINTITESTLEQTRIGDQVVAETLSYAESSDATALEPLSDIVSFDLNVSGQTATFEGDSVTLYGGTYYTVVVVAGSAASGPQALTFATALNTSIGSAPDSANTVAVVAAVTPVAIVTEAPAAATPALAVPTAAPVTGNAITGRVLLDPGANLQLRQNPSADALSLGLAAAGTTLVVNGREGSPVALVDGQPAPAEADTFEDPVGLLPDEETDLDPTTTWVNVTYSTPDGGQITSWVLAQFLDIRDSRNEEVRLRDLEPIGGNVPGSAVETAVTPPPLPTDVLQAVVFNLDSGVSLNIRRTPSTDGEVIGRVVNGTTLVFLGGSDIEDDPWVYVQYTSPEGGVIEGWVTTLYVQYQYNGRKYSLEDFQNLVSRATSQALYEVVPSDTIGGVRGTVAALSVPTVDPLRDQFVATVQLDSGSNLQLRRLPDPTSESLNLVSTGTQLIVTSRTAAADWLKVTFEGEVGWISSGFVSITFNGATVSLNDVPEEVAPAG